MLARFNAYIYRIASNRAEMIRVEVDYENANATLGSLTFDVPLADAPLYFIGKRLTIEIREGWEPTGDDALDTCT